MRSVKVVFDFIRCSYSEKIAKGRYIYAKMNGNPNFPSPDVALSTLKESTDQLESYYMSSFSGSRVATARLHMEVKIWNDLMRDEAKYVTRISDNDVAILLSSGFNPAKPTIPGARAEFSVKNVEKSGSVFLRKKASKYGCAYIWQCCKNALPENEKDWSYANVSVKASCILNDLTPLTRYWFRAAVVSTKGISAYCNPVTHVVI